MRTILVIAILGLSASPMLAEPKPRCEPGDWCVTISYVDKDGNAGASVYSPEAQPATASPLEPGKMLPALSQQEACEREVIVANFQIAQWAKRPVKLGGHKTAATCALVPAATEAPK